MDIEQLQREVSYTATTSSGAGGQHVNKVATRVQVELDVENSTAFTNPERERILESIGNRLTKDGRLQLSSQDTRSQATNKERVFQKLLDVLNTARKPKKVRKKRRTPAHVKRKRLNDKKKHGEKKSNRNFRY
ncbi:ribosome-associated protein [Nonlabens sp. Hel1_33_55]|uniref:alternative ribosome rescue aminoacyl-tRNA hydrolase ArfB n=1 Tax=Nonlabens sp. Hel1_33_55 TaxID=1336802 RepID=UPI000875D9AF|nr:alternative ribosome rescue aminoacyl-tRNA hydrolase ArfB [Nonlabens sp. Hel1_33_55]SCY36322.1 ribosome-associated protein [Nonlabens sp. Hel1_33_55]